MNIKSTEFDELLILKPKVFQDARGVFYESWNCEQYKELGLNITFQQDDFSLSHKNVLRGLHGQKGQGKLIQVIEGCVQDFLVDIRPKSKTFLKYFTLQLTGSDPTQIYAPDGFVHGFCVLSDKAIMHYKCTTTHNKNQEFGFRWNDPTFQIQWPKINFIISERDAQLPSFEK